MKTSTLILAIVMTGLFILAGCNDKSSSLLTGTQSELATAGAELGVVEITTTTGDGTAVTKTVNKVYWDGVSKLEPGVPYVFRNEEEKLAALSTDPVQLNAYTTMKRLGKSKVKDGGSELAVTGTASAYVFYRPGPNYLSSQSLATNSTFTENDVIHHFIDTGWWWYHYYWVDGAAHETDIFDPGEPCPMYTVSTILVQLNSSTEIAYDRDDGECN